MTSHIKNWLKAASAVLVLAVIFGVVNGFTNESAKPAVEVQSSYFFAFTGSPGQEADKTLWVRVTGNPPACNGINDGCLIEVDADFTELDDEDNIILSENVPVTSGAHQNPIEGVMVIKAYNKNP